LSWPPSEAAIQLNKFHRFGFRDWMAGHILGLDPWIKPGHDIGSSQSQHALERIRAISESPNTL